MHCFAILHSLLTHVLYCHDRLVSICWISFIPMSFFHSKSGLVVQPNDRDAVFGRAEQDQDDNDDDEATTQQQRRRITMYRDGFVVDAVPVDVQSIGAVVGAFPVVVVPVDVVVNTVEIGRASCRERV